MASSLAATCCRALLLAAGAGKVYLPDSAGYASSLSSYFSQQEAQLSPGCVAAPTSAEQVSAIVKTLVQGDCQFAVRSGGHMSQAGAANIADGVTIDLQALNSITLNSNQSIASIGPGATWLDVYSTLDPLGLTVIGGRDPGVGVGGLALGGGISYLSPRYGWTCDTVQRFQIVLADGSIATVTEKSNPDLMFALRGGSNNFGIVTRFDFQTVRHGKMLGGMNIHDISLADEVIKEVVAISTGTYDEYASFFTTFSYTSAMGSAVVMLPIYTKPVEKPRVFEKVMSLPTLISTVRITNMTDIISESGASPVPSRRQYFRTTTFAATEAVLKATFNQWQATTPGLAGVKGLTWLLLLQPLPPTFYQRHATANALGFQGRNKDLLIALIWPTWDDAADDELVIGAADTLLANIEREAKDLNAFDSFKYLNYAAPDQKPISTYGAENVKRLKAAQQKYDPEGVFTKNVPGGFKLPRRRPCV